MGRPGGGAAAEAVCERPGRHWSRARVSATPVAAPRRKRQNIKLTGEIPSPIKPPSGCACHPRCPYARDVCVAEDPPLYAYEGAQVACHGVVQGWVDVEADWGARTEAVPAT